MKLYLNHTERYLVEQLQMQLFASEPSVDLSPRRSPRARTGRCRACLPGKKICDGDGEDHLNGKTGSAAKRLLREQADVRHTRRLLQQSYYLAAMQVLDTVPPLGRALRRPAEQAVDKGTARGQERAVRPSGSWNANFFVTPERAKALCRRIGAYR